MLAGDGNEALQPLLHLSAGSGDSGFDRADLAVCHQGDLVVGEAFQLSQNEHDFELRRQLLDSVTDRFGQLMPLGYIIGHGGDIGDIASRIFFQPICLRGIVDGDRRVLLLVSAIHRKTDWSPTGATSS